MKSRLLTLAALATLALATAACSDGKTATSVANPLPLKTEERLPPPLPPVPPPPSIAARGYILMDASNGQVLAASNDTSPLEPASLTKIMTAYAVFDALRTGSLKLEDKVTISEHAWRVGGAASEGSTSFLPVNSQAPVQVLLQGMIVQSGNDASIALAERVAGSEEAFAHLMNTYAKRLGMTATHFENRTGLPGPNHRTTAHDMALLATAIIRDFPQYYPMFAERKYTFNGITQHNRNGLLDRDPTVDGLKTGHTEAAGYCLVSSAKRDSMRLVSVVMGTKSMKAREDASQALLNYGFSFFESKSLYASGQSLGKIRIWKGATEELDVGLTRDAVLTIPRGRATLIQTKLDIPPSAIAPIDRSTSIGKVSFMLEGKEIASQPLYPLADVAQAGFFGRMYDSVLMKFK
jgi:serine-type D-Ala-D-Ala carboxypeptidase (penicillin-binding protein 5/6)